MEWTAEEDIMQDIDNLSFMTSGTPQNKIQDCGLVLTPSEPMFGIPVDEESFSFDEVCSRPTLTGKGRGAVFKKKYDEINKQAWMDNEIQSQLRKHSPYTYSNEFIEMHVGKELKDDQDPTIAEDREQEVIVPLLNGQIENLNIAPLGNEPRIVTRDGPRNGQFEDCSPEKTPEKKTRSNKIPSLYAMVKNKGDNECANVHKQGWVAKNGASVVPEKVSWRDECRMTNSPALKVNGRSNPNSPEKSQSASSRLFLNAVKAVSPSYVPNSVDFPPLQEMRKRKKT